MAFLENCAWITHAFREEDVEMALVLGKSLRRVLTRAKLVIIVGRLPRIERQRLVEIFDWVLPLNEDLEELHNRISSECLAFLHGTGLTAFKKCAFLHPHGIVVKNPDWIFNAEKKTRENLSLNVTDWKICPYLIEPSKSVCNRICGIENMKIGDELDFAKQNTGDIIGFLQNPLFASVDVESECSFGDFGNVEIIHLKHFTHVLETLNSESHFPTEKAGLVEKKLLDLWLEIYKSNEFSLSQDNHQHEPIAVVGMACRLPSANNLNEFWDLMIEWKDAIRTPPSHRWTKEQVGYILPGSENTLAGFLSDPIEEFDAKFFEISPNEAEYIDPQHRLLMEVAWESLENAGINPQSLNGSPTGVFVGEWLDSYKEVLESQGRSNDIFRTALGSSVGVGAARISHLLKLTGPTLGIESDCSAGSAMVHQACRSLRCGECDLALAAGVNLLIKPFLMEGGKPFLAPDGHCKTFDAKADGFGRAEGCGVLILKRLSDAIRDNNHIWGLIRGTGVSQEGLSSSLGTPTVYGQSLAMEGALRDATVHPQEVSYVEAHGTGTVVGDSVELSVIKRVYGDCDRRDDLIIGSVKTNIGHTEACSGIAGIIKVLLAMSHEKIPPHRNFKHLNPKADIKRIPAKIPLEAIEWPRIIGKSRIGAVSSFGLGGVNTHIILEEPPQYLQITNQPFSFPQITRPINIVHVSAKSNEALEILLEKYKNLLENKATMKNAADIAYTANTGRASFPFKAAITVDNSRKILKIYKKQENDTLEKGNKNELCFLFTGQGSQYHGMAKELYESSPVFRIHFDFCANFLERHYSISLVDTYLSEKETEDCRRTLFSQTGIFAVQYGLMKLWESWGVKPNVVMGHSLGEFCAAVCAGMLDIEDALTLVAERSRLIDSLPTGKMIVVMANRVATEKLQNEFISSTGNPALDIAALNSEEQTVLAGDTEVVTKFTDFLKSEKGVKCSLLKSSHSFHSHHMDPILEEYRNVANKINYSQPSVGYTFISGMLGKPLNGKNRKIDSEYWVQHTRLHVDFINASKVACEDFGCRLFVEIGPTPILSAFIMMNNAKLALENLKCLPSLKRNEDNWKTLITTLEALVVNRDFELNWKGFDQFYERKNVGHLLPSHPYKKARFWPRINSMKSSAIHPLLGCNMTNATTANIFQSYLTVDDAAYLKDHAIGDLLVFPGAGFIEMILAAGNSCLLGDGNKLVQNSTQLICLSNFKIKSPLGLNEEGTLTTCQTIVQCPNNSAESDKDNGTHVEIYHLENHSSTKWMSHASGHISLQMENDDGKFLDQIHYDEQAIIALISDFKNAFDEHNVADIYSYIRNTGINFGPEFQSIKRIWSNPGSHALGEVGIPKDAGKYLLHPILIDAMIQQSAFNFNGKVTDKKLRVPVGCDKFILFSNVTTSKCYIYSDISTNSAALINEDGALIAVILNLQLAETTIEKIKCAIASTTPLPHFFKKEYRQERLGCFERRTVLPLTPDGISVLANNSGFLNLAMEKDVQMRAYFNKLSLSYIKNAFSKMGWKFAVGESINSHMVLESLQIHAKFIQPVEQFLRFLCDDGILEKCNDQNKVPVWLVRQLMPCEKDTSQDIKCLVRQHQDNSKILGKWGEAISLFQTVGDNLVAALRSTVSVLPILFPEDNQKASVTKFYEAIFSTLSNFLYSIWRKQFEEIILKYGSDPSKLPTLRILEIGAGSGGISSYLLKALTDAGIPFEYVYSDISAAFFPSAEKRFSEYVGSMKFKKLNIEESPISQGFPPQYFDIVVAALVLHFAEDVQKAIRNVRVLLKDGGNLWFTATSAPTPHLDFLFGWRADYWRFTDYMLRPNHNTLSADKWKHVLKQAGFSDSGCIEIDNNLIFASLADENIPGTQLSPMMSSSKSSQCVDNLPKWLIFHGDQDEYIATDIQQHMSHMGMSSVSAINCTLPKEMEGFTKERFWKNNVIEGIIFTIGACGKQTAQEKTAKPYLNLLQPILKLSQSSKMFLITSGHYSVEDSVCENPSAATLIGITTTAMNEYKDVKIKIIDVCPSEIGNTKKIIQEILYDLESQRAPVVVLRRDKIYRPIVTVEKPLQSDRLSLQNFSRFQLALPKTGLLSDLQFKTLEQRNLKNYDVEIQVKSTGLNFRDVLMILMPSEDFKQDAGVGLDFVGVVTKRGKLATRWNVGDEVFGMKFLNTVGLIQHFPSHICIGEDAIEKVPSTFTAGEASCLPAVFTTAYYSLVNVAHSKKGETVLIHSASGALGLVTIQVAKQLGLNIICTAGSTRKIKYLASIGIEHVFDSRSTNFQTDILRVTGQKGVDIVINSLTGEGFKEATLASCGMRARFIELSKINIWTTEEIYCLRPDVEYFSLNVASLEKKVTNNMLKTLKVWMEEEKIKPIPYVRYDAEDIATALKYFKEAKHIGKIICGMPQPPPNFNGSSLSGNKEKFTPLFNERSTYLITGGLGGIGLEVCKYMVEQGAKNIVLTGRTPPASDIIKNLNEMGKDLNIQVMIGDVGSETDCIKIFQKIKEEFPPLRGVMHAAGCLDDGVLENRQWENFQTTYRSKVEGTWNLHNLTKDMILEHFVLFSSVMAEIVLPGHSTHASACAFQDRFAQYRHGLGLPATSINWGHWGEVGIAADKTTALLKPFSVQQGINSLDYIMRKNELQVGVALFKDNINETLQFLPYTKWAWDLQKYAKSTEKSSSNHRMKLSCVKFWEDVDKCGNDTKMKTEVVKSYAEVVVKQVLKLEPTEKIDETTQFHTYGFDSLMMIELGNRFQLLFGNNKIIIPQTIIKEATTVKELGAMLLKIIENEFEELSPPTVEEVYSLCLKDSRLPEDIRPEYPRSEVAPSKIKRILMTGVTGYFGCHVLKELLENYPSLETIYCLVRGKQTETPIDTVLERNYLIIEPILMKKVVTVSGNFVEANLGLDERQYVSLSSAVDAIFHFGCKVNHYEHYMEVPNSNSDVRSVNVTGVLNILRFACKTKTKHIFFPTHAGVFLSVDKNNMETFADINYLKHIPSTMGYPISKIVDEALLKEAIFGRGIPCKIFRFSDLLARKSLNKSLMENNFIVKLLLVSMMEGVIPSTPLVPPFVPVDEAAEIATQVFFQDKAPNSVYNVIHPKTSILSQNFFNSKSEMERVDFDDYFSRLSNKSMSLIEMLKGNDRPTGYQNILFEIPLFTADANLHGYFREIIRNLYERFHKNKDFAVSNNLMKFAEELYLKMEDPEETLGRILALAQKEQFFITISS